MRDSNRTKLATSRSTRKIRQAVVKNNFLVIHDGSECKDYQHQWQRNLGPVKTEAEKNAIANKAETIAGAGKVNNQIEVKNQ